MGCARPTCTCCRSPARPSHRRPASLSLAGLPLGARFCDCPELRTSLTLNRAESLPQVQQSAVPGAAGPVPAAVALGNARDALPVLIRMPTYVTSSRDARRAQAQPCQVDGTGTGRGPSARRRRGGAGRGSARGGAATAAILRSAEPGLRAAVAAAGPGGAAGSGGGPGVSRTRRGRRSQRATGASQVRPPGSGDPPPPPSRAGLAAARTSRGPSIEPAAPGLGRLQEPPGPLNAAPRAERGPG